MTESLGAYPAEQTIAPNDGAPSLAFPSAGSRQSGLARPAPLIKGDTIGVVAPSYAPYPAWLSRGVQAMEESGYRILLESEVQRERRFHQREDEQRAENLMKMWSNPEVKAVIAATGGDGGGGGVSDLRPPLFRPHPQHVLSHPALTPP